jgi:hypothetical protein
MKDTSTERLKALQDHWESFRCEHEGTDQAIRKRTVRGGVIQYVYQCLSCGSPASNPISKIKATEINGGVEPEAFDDGLITKWNQARDDGEKKITGHFNSVSEFQRSEFHKWYGEYLESEEWKSKREKVFKRAVSICEGCLESPAEVVHHITYKNVGNEFLFELIALCHECHDRYHASEEGEEENEN